VVGFAEGVRGVLVRVIESLDPGNPPLIVVSWKLKPVKFRRPKLQPSIMSKKKEE
jgi:hypothetical protein